MSGERLNLYKLPGFEVDIDLIALKDMLEFLSLAVELDEGKKHQA